MDAPARLSRTLFYGCIVLATAVFAYGATQPLLDLLGIVPDDTFYYLKVAQNLAATGKSTFDGINPTNGYHPGWMAVMVLLAKIVSQPVALMRACLFAGFAFHLASSFLLVVILKRYTSPTAAYVGAALWAINPLSVHFALQGMEASFYVFALALAMWVYATRIAPPLQEAKRTPSIGDFVLFGLGLALCFWGRTEAIILTAFVILGVTFQFRRTAWTTAFVGCSAGFVIGVVPWFAYSYLATGSWFQRSGSMKLLWASALDSPTGKPIRDAFLYVFGGWMTYPLIGIPDDVWLWERTLLSLAATVALAAILMWQWRRVETRRFATMGFVLLAATLATGIVYAAMFSDMQYWYKTQSSILLYVVSFIALANLIPSRQPSGPWLVTSAVAIAAVTMASALVLRISTLDPYPWQRDAFRSQQLFDTLVPADEPIGCFNAGISAFFGSHVVINLDGLMNNVVYDYYRNNEFDRYLDVAKIHYIADDMEAMKRAMCFTQHIVPLDVVSTAPLEGWPSGKRYLWRVREKSNTSERR